jgi:hypothetical protein
LDFSTGTLAGICNNAWISLAVKLTADRRLDVLHPIDCAYLEAGSVMAHGGEIQLADDSEARKTVMEEKNTCSAG